MVGRVIGGIVGRVVPVLVLVSVAAVPMYAQDTTDSEVVITEDTVQVMYAIGRELIADLNRTTATPSVRIALPNVSVERAREFVDMIAETAGARVHPPSASRPRCPWLHRGFRGEGGFAMDLTELTIAPDEATVIVAFRCKNAPGSVPEEWVQQEGFRVVNQELYWTVTERWIVQPGG